MYFNDIKQNIELKNALCCLVNEDSNSEVISQILNVFQDIRNPYEITAEELYQVHGLTKKKAKLLYSALSLHRCIPSKSQKEYLRITNPIDVADLLMDEMKYLDREHFCILLLNTKNVIISIETVSIGSLNSSIVNPREVFKSAIKKSANAVIAAHNHPSGDPTPSQSDIDITRRLVESGELLGIKVLDHLIIGDGTFISLKEKLLL